MRTNHKNLLIGGSTNIAGWETLNADPSASPDIIGDLADLNSLPSDAYSVIYLSHVLEHIELAALRRTIATLHRILARNGSLMISVPDLARVFTLMGLPSLTINEKVHLMRIVYGGNISKYDYHYFGFTEEILRFFLEQAGFRAIRRVGRFNLFQDTSEFAPYFGIPISINVVAKRY